MTTYFIETTEALDTLCRELAEHTFVTVDTEFVRERTYYPRLALIQLGNEHVTACVDPLAVKDLTPLQTLFANPAITKVFHAAGQDMELFFHLFGELPRSVYDTQIGATLQGQGEQIGYAPLVKEMLGVELDKSHSRTDWLQRPLSKQQVRYAEDDVRYLTQIYPIQRGQLEERGRLEWLDTDFAELVNPERYRPAPESAWRKVKGISKLRPAQLAILKELAAWREQRAMKTDIPRRRVISDELLLDMARLQPKTPADMAKLRGIAAGLVDKYGATLLELIAAGLAVPKEQWPRLPKKPQLNSEQDSIVDALVTIIKLCAAEYQLSATSLATRKELEQLVNGDREVAVLQGWRLKHGGQQLLDFLEGGTALGMEDGRLTLTH